AIFIDAEKSTQRAITQLVVKSHTDSPKPTKLHAPSPLLPKLCYLRSNDARGFADFKGRDDLIAPPLEVETAYATETAHVLLRFSQSKD
ncbi:MAG: hypothetical protein AAFW84_32350, partial [Cyanobacteria bacterium J06635_15]